MVIVLILALLVVLSKIGGNRKELNDVLGTAIYRNESCFERVEVGKTGLFSKRLEVLVTTKCKKQKDYIIAAENTMAIRFFFIKYRADFKDLDPYSVAAISDSIFIPCKGDYSCVAAEAGFRGEDGKLYIVNVPDNLADSSGRERIKGLHFELDESANKTEKVVTLIADLIKEQS